MDRGKKAEFFPKIKFGRTSNPKQPQTIPRTSGAQKGGLIPSIFPQTTYANRPSNVVRAPPHRHSVDSAPRPKIGLLIQKFEENATSSAVEKTRRSAVVGQPRRASMEQPRRRPSMEQPPRRRSVDLDSKPKMIVPGRHSLDAKGKSVRQKVFAPPTNVHETVEKDRLPGSSTDQSEDMGSCSSTSFDAKLNMDLQMQMEMLSINMSQQRWQLMRAIVLSQEMPFNMQEQAIILARRYLDREQKISYRDLTRTIKEYFDEEYGQMWHCIAGQSFSSKISHSKGCFLHFSIDNYHVLLFKTTDDMGAEH